MSARIPSSPRPDLVAGPTPAGAPDPTPARTPPGPPGDLPERAGGRPATGPPRLPGAAAGPSAAGPSAAGPTAAGLAAVEIGFVGLGRAGRAMAVALARAGARIGGVHVRSPAAAARAAALLPGVPVRSVAELARQVDVLVLAVPDDAIEATATDLAGSARTGQLVAHLSGRHGLGALRPLRSGGALLAAVHPIMSLAGSDPMADADRLAGATFGITADPAAWPLVRALVAAVGGRAVAVAEEQRTVYHAALVLGGNFLATLVGTAADLLSTAGVDDARGALAPLLRVQLDNALREGDAAMTGPVRRGDVGTVSAQLAALRAVDPAVAAGYEVLAGLTVDRLVAAGLLATDDAAALVAALAHDPGAVRVASRRGDRRAPS